MDRSRLRVLHLADTHLGFDLPFKPRVERRRRGPDFFANFSRALTPALEGKIDLVVHAGDVLYRSKVPPQLVQMAFEPLKQVADQGVPVVVVPGNHERSQIPYPLFAVHPNIHILDRPRTVVLELQSQSVAVAGFPFQRDDLRTRFPTLIESTGWRQARASLRLLCLHQTVEGARVGPVGYTFRGGDDVIRGSDLPPGFAAVLAGHIHRHQVLTTDLAGRPLAAPVLYPGSIERTSAAEREETKGFITLEFTAGEADGGRLREWTFHPLPARPMVDVDLDVNGLRREQAETQLANRLAEIDADAVVRVRVTGLAAATGVLSAAAVRRLAPPTVSVTMSWPRPARPDRFPTEG